MKTAEIYATPSGTEPGYVWNWRCPEANAASAKPFVFYHDWVADAREHGYRVELAHAQGASAPGGAAIALDRNKG